MNALDPMATYLSIFVAPFVQEDAAVIAAASAAALGAGDPPLLFAALMAGMVISDTWKYWLGRYGRTHAWAMRFVEKPGVQKAGRQVLKRLGVTLFIARFVPGTRIPTYIASGLFAAPFLPFLFYVVASGVVYAALMFAAFALLGEVLGREAMHLAPWVALAILSCVLLASVLRHRFGRVRGAEGA